MHLSSPHALASFPFISTAQETRRYLIALVRSTNPAHLIRLDFISVKRDTFHNGPKMDPLFKKTSPQYVDGFYTWSQSNSEVYY
jgi:hypothetical protein